MRTTLISISRPLRQKKNLDRRISKSIKCSIKNVYIIQRQSSHPTEVIYLLGQDASIRLPASIFYFKSLGRLSASIFHFMRSLFFLVFFYFLMPAHAFHPFLSITPQHIITPSIEQNPSPPYCSCGLISFPLPSRPIDQLGSSVSSSHPEDITNWTVELMAGHQKIELLVDWIIE